MPYSENQVCIGGYHCHRSIPHFQFKMLRMPKGDRNNPCFGGEIEVGKRNAKGIHAVKFLNAMGLEHDDNSPIATEKKDHMFWFSSDTSVQGFEIVSQPMSLAKWKSINLDKGFAKLEELGFCAWDSQRELGCSCGLHFHMSRSYMASNTSNPEEVLTVVVNNLEGDLKIFSGRRDFQWCRPFEEGRFWSYKLKNAEQPTETNRIMNTKDKASGCHSNRYHMVNFTNDETIEIRIFRGTLNYETFIGDLQLVAMLCEIGKRFSVEQACNVNWAYLVQFAKAMGYKEFLATDRKRRR